MYNLFGVSLFQKCIVNLSLQGGWCILSICALSYMWHLFGCNSIPKMYCQLGWWYKYPQYMCIMIIWVFRDLLSIGVVDVSSGLYDVSSVYWSLGGCVYTLCYKWVLIVIVMVFGVSGGMYPHRCAFCWYVYLFGVTLFHNCVWSLGGIYVSSVYVHSVIYVTHLV